MIYLSLLAMYLSPTEGTVWQIRETGIYRSISKNHVAMNAEGEIFILNGQEKNIAKHDAQGNFLKRFGKAGQGPGEMGMPMMLFADEAHIVVLDMIRQALIFFDTEGKYQTQKRIDIERGNNHTKVKNGWVFGTWQYFAGNERHGQLIWVDEDLKNPTVLLDLDPASNSGNSEGIGNISFNLNEGIPYNPAEDSPMLAVSDDGGTLFLRKRSPAIEIVVFDMEKKTVIRTIRKAVKPIPFDKTWGQQRIDAANNRKSGGGSFVVKHKPNFPENFPSAKGCYLFNKKVYVERWMPNPGLNRSALVFDFEGHEVSGSLPPEALSRIVSLRDGFAIVVTFDTEEEEAGLAKVSVESLASFIKANPLDPYANRGGTFVIQ